VIGKACIVTALRFVDRLNAPSFLGSIIGGVTADVFLWNPEYGRPSFQRLDDFGVNVFVEAHSRKIFDEIGLNIVAPDCKTHFSPGW